MHNILYLFRSCACCGCLGEAIATDRLVRAGCLEVADFSIELVSCSTSFIYQFAGRILRAERISVLVSLGN